MKRFYIISTLILWVTIVGYSQAFSPENAKLDTGCRLASLMYGDAVSFEDAEQDTKRLAAQGEKAYKKIREYIKKEEYRKALDTFEAHMVDIYLYFRCGEYVYPFYEYMLELYSQELTEVEEAIKKDINVRQFYNTIMEGIFAIEGSVPEYYYENANMLSYIYYKQEDYNMAADIANHIVSVFEQTGDTICTSYAMALFNLGSIYWKELCSTIDSLGVDELENEPDDVVDIYEKNDWVTDFDYSMARLDLLFTYIEMGEMQKAKELYAVIKAEDEEDENELFPFEGIIGRVER